MLEKYGEFLDVKECAALLHRTEWSVCDLCRREVLPHVKICRRILIPKERLIEYIEQNMKGERHG